MLALPNCTRGPCPPHINIIPSCVDEQQIQPFPAILPSNLPQLPALSIGLLQSQVASKFGERSELVFHMSSLSVLLPLLRPRQSIFRSALERRVACPQLFLKAWVVICELKEAPACRIKAKAHNSDGITVEWRPRDCCAAVCDPGNVRPRHI